MEKGIYGGRFRRSERSARTWHSLEGAPLPGEKQRNYDFALFTDQILGLSMEENAEKPVQNDGTQEAELSPEIRELVNQRTEAKKKKDFKTADEIRDRLKTMGVTLIDTKEGVRIVTE